MTSVIRRISSMGAHELYVRGSQEISKRFDSSMRVFGYGIPRPRPVDTNARFFFTASDIPEIKALYHAYLPERVDDVVRHADKVCAGRFDLLGFQDLTFGSTIDWHLDPVNNKRAPLVPWYRVPFLDFARVGDHKIIWELNRHQYMVTLAKAFVLTGDIGYAEAIEVHWDQWWQHNPRSMGINWASALEVAFRGLAWIWVEQILRSAPMVSRAFLAKLRGGIAIHARHVHRYLSTYFAPNTHLLGEAVFLFFCGTLYPSAPRATRWRTAGWRIVLEQSHKQVRNDGFHFEQSLYYHVYAVDFFLHALFLAERNDHILDPSYVDAVARMLDALAGVTQAGVPIRCGDDDGGRLFDPSRNRPWHMSDPLYAGAQWFDRPDWKARVGQPVEEALWLVGPQRFRRFVDSAPTEFPKSSRDYPDTGIYVSVPQSGDAWQIAIDGGPHGVGTGGHGHADALGIQLSGCGRQWLVDAGTGSYMDRTVRERLRSTINHNTMTALDESQAIPTGPFSWKGIPTVSVDSWIVSREVDVFKGMHDGYSRLTPPIAHHRWVVRINTVWLVRDCARGSGDSRIAVSWIMAPDLDAQYDPDQSSLDIRDMNGGHLMLLSTGEGWSGALEVSKISPVYGQEVDSHVLRMRRKGALPAELVTAIIPQPVQRPHLRCETHTSGSRYELELEGGRYRITFPVHPEDANQRATLRVDCRRHGTADFQILFEQEVNGQQELS